ncbi:bacteriophage Lambda NinG protein, partial [Escherichia coli FRIK1996]
DITGQLLRHLNSDLMNAIFTSNAWCATSTKAEISFRIASN